MIKLSKCCSIYTKAIELWQSKTTAYKKIWENFCLHLIAEYENLLAEGGGTKLGQEGYETEFNTTEDTMENSSITESIVRYTEYATTSKGKVKAL